LTGPLKFQIGDQGLVVLIQHLGADGDPQHHVLGVGAVAVAAHAMRAGGGLEVLLVAVVDQGVQPLHRLHPDISALAPVAAVRPAVGNELLAAERHRAGPAVAGADIHLGLVEELHRPGIWPFARPWSRLEA
jgi:hypothetical protein